MPATARVCVVAARFNAHIVGKLLEGCLSRLEAHGLTGDRVASYRVPGAFELPLAAKWAAQTEQFAAVICLGAVVRGETPHFEYVCENAAAGVRQVQLETGVPVIFGVLTTNDEHQAFERTGGGHGHAGEQAADAALEMIVLHAALRADAAEAGQTSSRGPA